VVQKERTGGVSRGRFPVVSYVTVCPHEKDRRKRATVKKKFLIPRKRKGGMRVKKKKVAVLGVL